MRFELESMVILVTVVGVAVACDCVKLAVQVVVVLEWCVVVVQLVLPVWDTVADPVVDDPVCVTWTAWQDDVVHCVEVGKVVDEYMPLVTAVKVKFVGFPEVSST